MPMSGMFLASSCRISVTTKGCDDHVHPSCKKLTHSTDKEQCNRNKAILCLLELNPQMHSRQRKLGRKSVYCFTLYLRKWKINRKKTYRGWKWSFHYYLAFCVVSEYLVDILFSWHGWKGPQSTGNMSAAPEHIHPYDNPRFLVHFLLL